VDVLVAGCQVLVRIFKRVRALDLRDQGL